MDKLEFMQECIVEFEALKNAGRLKDELPFEFEVMLDLDKDSPAFNLVHFRMRKVTQEVVVKECHWIENPDIFDVAPLATRKEVALAYLQEKFDSYFGELS